jgi:hypothetical protein
MVKAGVLNGLSVGFRPEARGVAIDERGRRTIGRPARGATPGRASGGKIRPIGEPPQFRLAGAFRADTRAVFVVGWERPLPFLRYERAPVLIMRTKPND